MGNSSSTMQQSQSCWFFSLKTKFLHPPEKKSTQIEESNAVFANAQMYHVPTNDLAEYNLPAASTQQHSPSTRCRHLRSDPIRPLRDALRDAYTQLAKTKQDTQRTHAHMTYLEARLTCTTDFSHFSCPQTNWASNQARPDLRIFEPPLQKKMNQKANDNKHCGYEPHGLTVHLVTNTIALLAPVP